MRLCRALGRPPEGTSETMHHYITYPNINPIAFHLGPLAVHWYGISYLVGFICVYLWLTRPTSRALLGLTTDAIQDFMVYALAGVIVGGRTLFVIADIITNHNFAAYLAHPIDFIAVWQGGMAFHGGLIGVVIAGLLFLRKHPGLSYRVLGDQVVMLLPIGIALTRVVNFINDELPGRSVPASDPWGVQFPNFPGYRWPSQLMEGALDILALPLLFAVRRLDLAEGSLFWFWFTYYGVTRTIAEFFREPGFYVLGLTGGQLLAVPQIVIGVVMLIWVNVRYPRPATQG
ncbi:prolipoprotein diacylglyceryl transferase [bacterium]|nr:MAG: prolipoprotein diacylglyceryl transferase [bacterium]